MMNLTFSTKGMNKIKTKLRKIFSYKRFCMTICGVLLFTQFAAPRTQAQSTVRYTALGDSIAFGLRANPFTNGYVYLYRQLFEGATGVNVELFPLGVPGLTSRQLLRGLIGIQEVRELIASSTIVTVNIGGSDLARARSLYKAGMCGGADNQNCLRAAVAAFGVNFNAILAIIVSLRSPSDTIIRTMNIYNPFVNVDMAQNTWPNDEGNDFQVINMYLDRFNNIIAAAANAPGRNIPVADVHLRFNGPIGDIDPSSLGFIADDGVHPNDRGHQEIANLLRALGFSPFDCSASGRKSFHRGLNRTS